MDMRPVDIQIGFLQHTPGSVLISFGNTRVLCTALLEDGTPSFLHGSGNGWLTAEYAMLPASTGQRKARDFQKRDGRSVEIQRLIGRVIRQALDLTALGDHTIYIDCDVLQADGGTRTASITGAFVALTAGVAAWIKEGRLRSSPLLQPVAAVSVGLVDDHFILDLDYAHDSRAQVDMNVVMTGDRLLEVQGTGERRPFTRDELTSLLDIAQTGIVRLFGAQMKALGSDAKYVRDWIAPLIIATQNPGKLREMRVLLGQHFSNAISLTEAGIIDQIEEDGESFEQNAVLKAEYAMRETACAALADDSGLEVDALQGEPGVHSARYAGENGHGMERDQANRCLLLKRLRERGLQGPYTARFVCAVALARPGKSTLVVRGSVEGQIAPEPSGEDGFGYDPMFIAQGESLTFAQMSQERKNEFSHRRRALDALLERLAIEKQAWSQKKNMADK